MKKLFQSKKTKQALLALGLLGVAAAAAATPTGTHGQEFHDAKEKVTGWLTGDLGITIATAGGIWGMIAAVAGNIRMAALGVGIAAVAALTGPVIAAVFGATI